MSSGIGSPPQAARASTATSAEARFTRDRRAREGPPQLHEQGLEGERRLQLELLQLAPGLPDELGRGLGRSRALGRRVLSQRIEVVDVDRGALGAHGDGDQVAVPRAQLVEHEQQLLALGAAGCAPQPLLRLARGKLLALELLLGRGARFLRPHAG